MKKNHNQIDVVYKGESAWKELDDNVKERQNPQVFIICDINTEKYCLPYFLSKQNFKIPPKILTIPDGEKHKNIFTCIDLWKELSEAGADRNCIIINLGGGVVTDLGGFVAATFQRGISFINVPTSLLAMVDAAIGGKTGVDLEHLKNQVGLIQNPDMVLIDSQFLKTLPERELYSGMAEMLKHGLIDGNDYWNRMVEMDIKDEKEFEDLIWDSIKIKHEIVIKDPKEKNLRKTLNYGHTLGHAIESYYLASPSKKLLLHGEAIGIGIILETYISHKMLGFPKETLLRIADRALSIYRHESFSLKEIDEIIRLLTYDKKNRDGKVLFVLLENIGICKIDEEVDKDLIIKSFEFYEKLKKNS